MKDEIWLDSTKIRALFRDLSPKNYLFYEVTFYDSATMGYDLNYDEVVIGLHSPKWEAFVQKLLRIGYERAEIERVLSTHLSLQVPPHGALTLVEGDLVGALTEVAEKGGLTAL